MTARSRTPLTILCAAALLCAPIAAPVVSEAQSMSPMRGKVNSFTDAFAVRVYPANPYDHRIKVEIKVYDADFRPVRALVSPDTMLLAGNSSRQVTVMIPFGEEREKRIRICTESVPYAGRGSSNIRAQICGKFIGRRR